MNVKEFFCPERCLYCLDKLNPFADIATGDNYTGQFSKPNGTSCLFIRTELGEKIFDRYKHLFAVDKVDADLIAKTQNIELRKNNFIYSVYKSAEVGYSINELPPKNSAEFSEKISNRREYARLLLQIRMGLKRNFPAVHAELWKIIRPELRKLKQK